MALCLILTMQMATGAILPPVLDAPLSPTEANPYLVTGTATPDSTVRLYVNGDPRQSTQSGADGHFAFSAALIDGVNSLYVTQFDGSEESMPSNTINVDYINVLSRMQGGKLSQDAVWTPGSGEPYVVTAHLTVANGVTLTLKAGTVLKFESGVRLQVDGTLKVEGTEATPVTFTSNSASPAAGDWSGIRINGGATDVVIDHAVIEYAVNGILFNTNGTGAVRDSILRHNQVGAYFNTVSTGTLTHNLIHDSTHGVLVRAQATPQITNGNEITANQHGIYALGDDDAANNPRPVVTGNSLHDNTGYHYRTDRFGAPATATLNATGNWWGTTDPIAIAAKIYDYHDNPSVAPTVDFSDYLDGPDGNPVPNTAPDIVINSPANDSGFVTGVTVTFTASATDTEDGDLSSTIRWSSDQDGALGTGADLNTDTLSTGTHTITATVTDSGGLGDTATITIHITTAEDNTPPLVIITAPRNGWQFPLGVPITFRASVTDAEDGDLGSRLQWSSDVDGVLGTGATLTLNTLTVARHAITASVTDLGGLTTHAQRTLSVVTPLICTPLKTLQMSGPRFGPRPR